MDAWRPERVGPLEELPETLMPLSPVKEHVLVLSDFEAKHCDAKNASHEPTGGEFLVGKECKHPEEPQVRGASIDQVVARKSDAGHDVDVKLVREGEDANQWHIEPGTQTTRLRGGNDEIIISSRSDGFTISEQRFTLRNG